MEWLHLILNLAALLLWIHWRHTPAHSSGSKAGFFKRHGTRLARGSVGLLLLAILLVGRAWFYHRIAPEVDWQPRVTFIAFTPEFSAAFSLPFTWADFGKQLAFSVISFSGWLVLYNFVLVFASTIKPATEDARRWRYFLRSQLGFLDMLPAVLIVPLAILLGASVHYGSAWWLMQLGILPGQSPEALLHLASGMAVLNLRIVAWMALGVLGLYVLNSYIYFGEHKFWKIIDSSGQAMLSPLRLFPLQWGKVDFAPLAAMAAAWGGLLLMHPERLSWLYQRLIG
ncbi:MAG: hypothetical protein CMO74_11435 [Verrucomicrobiales bacterium]|nr:hypothetical protein [Verrucomicrobiales bacterium]|tara:strand:+ start:188 stop:1039 length:852 start_codon:yes stop_codon:yes gene_type:complete